MSIYLLYIDDPKIYITSPDLSLELSVPFKCWYQVPYQVPDIVYHVKFDIQLPT